MPDHKGNHISMSDVADDNNLQIQQSRTNIEQLANGYENIGIRGRRIKLILTILILHTEIKLPRMNLYLSAMKLQLLYFEIQIPVYYWDKN